ncbi:hypothetical protein [Nocardia sp. NPDC050718]|uniref:hypothetical protein n=1 Tax=Nocardia sp. NPDC050718 TaxID=3155788 RepID=UPI0034059368
MESVGEFVVGVDAVAVQRSRESVLRLGAVAAWVGLVTAVFVAAITALLVWLAGPIGLVQLPVVAIFGVDGVRKLRRLRELRATWQAQGVPPTAMRLSPAGLRLSIDAAPDSVFLPWATVQGLRLHRKLGNDLLVIDLFPGVGPETGGVRGLEHPDVQRVLRKKVGGTKGLRTAVRILDQPVAAIDHVAAQLTGGRVRVHG